MHTLCILALYSNWYSVKTALWKCEVKSEMWKKRFSLLSCFIWVKKLHCDEESDSNKSNLLESCVKYVLCTLTSCNLFNISEF